MLCHFLIIISIYYFQNAPQAQSFSNSHFQFTVQRERFLTPSGLIIRFLMVLTRRAAKEAAEKAAAAGDNPATSPIDISEMSTSQQIDIEEQFQKSNNDDHSSSKEPLTAPGQHDGDDDDDNSNQFAVEQPSDPEKLYARKMPEPAAKTELGTHSHEGEIEENVEPVEEDVESSEESLRLEGPTDQKCIVSPADTAPKSFESRQAVSMRLRVGKHQFSQKFIIIFHSASRINHLTPLSF